MTVELLLLLPYNSLCDAAGTVGMQKECGGKLKGPLPLNRPRTEFRSCAVLMSLTVFVDVKQH